MKETALHYAVRLRRKDLVKLLLHAGADISIRETREGKTAYDIAIDIEELEIAESLHDHKGI